MNTQLRNGPAWTLSLEDSMKAPEEDAHSHPVHLLLTCQVDQAMGAPRHWADITFSVSVRVFSG